MLGLKFSTLLSEHLRFTYQIVQNLSFKLMEKESITHTTTSLNYRCNHFKIKAIVISSLKNILGPKHCLFPSPLIF